MDDDGIPFEMQPLYDYGNLPPNPEAFLNREAFVQLVKEKLQLYQLNESQLAAVYENYTCPVNDDLLFFSEHMICDMFPNAPDIAEDIVITTKLKVSNVQGSLLFHEDTARFIDVKYFEEERVIPEMQMETDEYGSKALHNILFSELIYDIHGAFIPKRLLL